MDEHNDAPDSQALLTDLAAAEHDILALARRHGLSLDQLAAWVGRAETRRALAGLCVLADAQTQLLLSRYRLIAATRLIAQVTSADGELPAEQVRKACADLLKIELVRAAGLGQEAGDDNEDAELDALRHALAGDDDNPSEDIATEVQRIDADPIP